MEINFEIYDPIFKIMHSDYEGIKNSTSQLVSIFSLQYYVLYCYLYIQQLNVSWG